MKDHILVIDDEIGIRETLTNILEDEGFEVSTAPSGEEGLALLSAHTPDLIMLDVWLPGMDGLDTLMKIRESVPTPVIMISGHGNIDMAVKAVQLGAYDFMEKPLSLEKVVLRVQRALEQVRLKEENVLLRSSAEPTDELIGECRAMVQLKEQVRVAASSHGRVLILGESGVGKELIARSLHKGSPRAHQPFVEVNCAAIPQELIESELFGHEKGSFTGAVERKRGKFELANGGTLFLDEVGDMSMATQAKLLRVIETQEFQRVGGAKTLRVNVRILSATNKDLSEQIDEGRFRQDLFYRLNVIPIHVPPLRERKQDIAVLARYFLARIAGEYGRKAKVLSAAAVEALTAYEWPGNVRELRNVMERLMIMHTRDEVDAADLPIFSRSARPGDYSKYGDLRTARSVFEKEFITARLEENAWNISRTAEELGIERSNLHRKLKSLGIQVP